MQRKEFTKGSLDEIAANLAGQGGRSYILNPHSSMLYVSCAYMLPDCSADRPPHSGLGNYDVNVILSALHLHGYHCIWFDRRLGLRLLLPLLLYSCPFLYCLL